MVAVTEEGRTDEGAIRQTRVPILAWVLLLIGVLVLAVFLLGVLGAADEPLGLDGGRGHFPNVLESGTPDPWRGPTYRGYAWATASELNRIHQGRELSRKIRFVPADEPSPNHFVASVNPIDNDTWGATARSSAGRCYAILTYNEPQMHEFGDTRYGIIPAGLACEARYATRQSVRLKEAPN